MPIAKEILNMLGIGIFDQKGQLKLLEMACDQFLTCLIFPLRWACFPIKDKCSHCAMDLDYCFRWLSTAPSHRIMALCEYPTLYTENTLLSK